MIRSGRVDLGVFIERARADSAERICSAMIQRAHLMLGTPVPAGFLHGLAPGRSWLVANRVVERVGGVRRRASSGIASGILLASGRGSAGATLVAGARDVGHAVAVRLGRPGLTHVGGPLAWNRVPDDGDVAGHRRRYLDWVASIG